MQRVISPGINVTSRKTQIILVSSTLILAAFLRFFGLTYQSLWNDELSSWRRSHYDSLQEVINLGVKPDVHPPGYQILLYFVERYFGDSAFQLRFPSALAGVLAVYLIYLLGLRLYSEKEALIAASLTAVLWFPVYYSQEARAYSLLMLFSIWSSLFWVKFMQNPPFKNNFMTTSGYVLTSLAAMYVHYYGFLVIAIHVLFTFAHAVKFRKRILKYIFPYILLLVFYSPWIPSMISQYSGNAGHTWMKPVRFSAVPAFLYTLFNDSGVLVGVFVSMLLISFIYQMQRHSREGGRDQNLSLNPTQFLFVWFLFPFCIACFVSLVATPVLSNRNLIISAPPAYLLFARGVMRFPVPDRLKIGFVSILIPALVFQLVVVDRYYAFPVKEQFREATKYISLKQKSIPGTPVVAFAWMPDYLNYYFAQHNCSCRVNLIAGTKADIPGFRKFIRNRKPAFFWYIRVNRKPDNYFIKVLLEENRLVENITFIGANVLLLQPDSNLHRPDSTCRNPERHVLQKQIKSGFAARRLSE